MQWGLGAVQPKIEVRNEDWPPGCLSRGLRLGRDPVMEIGIVSPPRVVGIRGKLLFSRSRGVNVFVGVGNDLLAALPHACPRLKILMALHWCCRVTPPPRAGYPGVGIPGNSCSRDPGDKSARSSWCGPKLRLRSETKIGPQGAYPRGLRLGRDTVMVIGIVSPFIPPPGVVGIRGKLVLEISGGKCVRWRGNDLPAVLSHAGPRLKILMAPPWCAQ